MALKKPVDRLLRWMATDHIVIIGIKQKAFLACLIAILFGLLIPFMYLASKTQQFNQEVDIICSNAWLYGCEDLEKAKPYCWDAYQTYSDKNCTHNSNSSVFQRLIQKVP